MLSQERRGWLGHAGPGPPHVRGRAQTGCTPGAALINESRENVKAALFSGRSCARAPNRCPGEDQNPWRLDMSEKMISRRDAFSLLGLAAALGFALPAEVLTASDAEAQAQTTAPAPSGGTVGMQRRHARRTGRHERRHARRTGRHERRETRRGGGEATEKK
jgi:hypothetical protein